MAVDPPPEFEVLHERMGLKREELVVALERRKNSPGRPMPCAARRATDVADGAHFLIETEAGRRRPRREAPCGEG